VQATYPCVPAVPVELTPTDAVSVLEVLDPAGARLEFIFGDLKLFCDLLCLVADHRVGQLYFLVPALVKPLGKL
jgi:hypothetical protein